MFVSQKFIFRWVEKGQEHRKARAHRLAVPNTAVKTSSRVFLPLIQTNNFIQQVLNVSQLHSQHRARNLGRHQKRLRYGTFLFRICLDWRKTQASPPNHQLAIQSTNRQHLGGLFFRSWRLHLIGPLETFRWWSDGAPSSASQTACGEGPHFLSFQCTRDQCIGKMQEKCACCHNNAKSSRKFLKALS